MAHLQSVQKKTSTMSLTISSAASSSREISSCSSSCSSSSSAFASQRHSSLVQPLCIAPQRTQSPQHNQLYSGNGVAPTFVKCLHDISTVKGQLVVLECRLRGTPPLQVLWYREDEQILDSDDFRILRKSKADPRYNVYERELSKASSASVPEELCTLVITEAFPEDSGLFKCMALNPFGNVSCSAELEVYEDLEEQLENEALCQQEAVSLIHEKETIFQEECGSGQAHDYPLLMPDPINLPPPDWPEENSSISNVGDYPESLPAVHPPEEPLGPGEDESLLKSEGQRSPEVTVLTLTPSPPAPPSPPPPSQAKEKSPAPKLFTPIKISFTSSSQSGNGNMNLSDLPSFTPSAIPPSAFNYERPRHFIQSQPSFQAPSYDSVLRDAQQNLDSPQDSQGQSSQGQSSQGQSSQGQSSQGQSSQGQVQNSQGFVQSSQKLVQSTHGVSQSTHGVSQNSVSLSERQAQSAMVSKQSQSVSRSQTVSQAQSVSQAQAQSMTQAQLRSLSLSQSQSQALTQANGTSKSSSGLSSPISPAPHPTTPSLPRTCSITLTPSLTPSLPSATGLGSATLPANPDHRSAPAAFLCSVLPSQSSSSSSCATRACVPVVSPSLPRSPLYSPLTSSSAVSQQMAPPPQSQGAPAVVSLPASYKGAPSTLPKPILKKSVAPRPSSARSTDEDIQGSKDALIQDLEKKLRSKEARRRNSQRLSYEERMARRLLGPDNASYVFDQDNMLDSPQDQSDLPEGRHTGGLWGKHHVGADERGNEGSAIQEKCYAPRFIQIPSDLTVEEGRFCRIDFKVGGLPTPDVCWYLDGKAIRPDDYHKMLVCEKSMHSFIIEIVTVHHAGVYECVARNRAGESRFSMRLDVIAQEALRPPTFVQKMVNSRALEGDTVRFECKVDASPPPQLFWKKDKDMLRIDPNRMSLYQDGSGRQCLLLERLVKSDAGWYTLSAINEAGMSTCNARLDVGTRTASVMKTAPPGSKTLKLLSSLSHLPALTVDSPAQHTAPLYESEEL